MQFGAGTGVEGMGNYAIKHRDEATMLRDGTEHPAPGPELIPLVALTAPYNPVTR